jgi:hypothetical protein
MKGRIKIELVISILAILIAGASLWVSIQQGGEIRQHNHLSVRPVLNFEAEFAEDNAVQRIYLKNFGPGPAIIKEFTIYIDGQPARNIGGDPWISILEILEEEIHYEYFWFFPGDTIGANDKYSILSINEEEYKNLKNKQAWARTISKVMIVIKYASVYDESFIAKYEPVRSSN